MNPAAIATAVLALYGDDPKRWTQHAMSRTPDGKVSDVRALPGACCWCLEGAVLAVCGIGDSWDAPAAHYHDFLEAVRAALGTERVYAWNDAPGRTFEDVQRVLRAIAEAP